MNKIKILLYTFSLFFLTSCKQWEVPNELIGDWTSEKQIITIRIKDDNGEFKFIKDTALLAFSVNGNRQVSGKLGTATFQNAEIVKNNGLPPSVTGIEFIIKEIKIGKISTNDPLEQKNIELWLSPIKNNSLEAEVRYTSNLSQFPMAGMLMKKTK